MNTKIKRIILLEADYLKSKKHLIAADGKEAISFAICGLAKRDDGVYLSVTEIVNLPYEKCIRSSTSITWQVREIFPLLDKNMCLIKIHSHPTGFTSFSAVDDKADKELFPKLYELSGCDLYHASMIMRADGSLLARYVDKDGNFEEVEKIIVPGDDIKIFQNGVGASFSHLTKRNLQTFGKGTVEKLKNLKIGVVGASGTGSIVVPLLSRTGVGKIVVVDPKVSRSVNMNRMAQLKIKDIEAGLFKADVLKNDIDSSEMGTAVVAMPLDISNPQVILELSTCDILIGCMDSIRGRHILNKISSYYGVPYLDIGVQLKANGEGGIETMCGAFRYIKPGGASILSMKVYTMEDLTAETMKQDDPSHFLEQEKNKYIKNADESAPAVMPVNGTIVNLAVMDLLARIHPYRYESNSEFNVFNFNFCDFAIDTKLVSETCVVFSRNLGAGDITPLLGVACVKKKVKNAELVLSI